MKSIRSSKICYIDGKTASAPHQLAWQLTALMRNCPTLSGTPVFVCIGSDRVPGDSLGPMVGTYLRCSSFFPYHVYGTLSRPIHAINLEDSMREITASHPDSPIIAIDASLGTRRHLHYITIAPGALSPGAGVNKLLMNVGDIAITGIINLSGDYAQLTLQSTRLSTVMDLAECISRGILLACRQDLLLKERS